MYLAIIAPVRWVPPTSGSTYSAEARSPFALKGGPSAPAARSHALTYDPYIHACMHTYACSSMIPYMELVYAQHSASRGYWECTPRIRRKRTYTGCFERPQSFFSVLSVNPSRVRHSWWFGWPSIKDTK